MRFLFLFLIAVFSNLSNAQIDIGTPGAPSNSKKMKYAINYVEYNAAIVSYARLCKFNENDIKKIEAKTTKNILVLDFSNSELEQIKLSYTNKINSLSEYTISNSECNIYQAEFIKIINIIDGKN